MKGIFKKLRYKRLAHGAKRHQAVEVAADNLPMAICCVFKNEAPYLKEWVEFHVDQGFQKFFLINNRSDDGFDEVLQPFIKSGIVYLFDSENEGMDTFIQAEEFNAVLNTMRDKLGQNAWVAFIDVDEYLFSIDKRIADVLNQFTGKKVAGALANWLMFGTNGKPTLEQDKPLTEQLTRRAPDEHDEHRLFKPIAYLPNVFRFFEGPHRPISMGDSRYYYSDGSEFQPGIAKFIHAPLRINHYWYRSEQYYREHKLGKRKSFGDIRDRQLEEWHMARCNEVEDKTILILQSK